MNFLACGPGRPVVSRMKGTRLMCGCLSILLLSALLAMCPGRVLAAATSDGLQWKRATLETSRYVTEPLRLTTRSLRACSRCPFTTRVRAGSSCSMKTLVPLCECLTSARHLATAACLRSTPPPYVQPQHWCCSKSTGLEQIRPAALLLGRIEPHLQRWELQDAATSISWLQPGNSGPQPRTSHCWAASVCVVDCEKSTRTVNRCGGEAKLLVEMSLDFGDSLLLCGLLAKGSAQWFEEETWLVHLL